MSNGQCSAMPSAINTHTMYAAENECKYFLFSRHIDILWHMRTLLFLYVECIYSLFIPYLADMHTNTIIAEAYTPLGVTTRLSRIMDDVQRRLYKERCSLFISASSPIWYSNRHVIVATFGTKYTMTRV